MSPDDCNALFPERSPILMIRPRLFAFIAALGVPEAARYEFYCEWEADRSTRDSTDYDEMAGAQLEFIHTLTADMAQFYFQRKPGWQVHQGKSHA